MCANTKASLVPVEHPIKLIPPSAHRDDDDWPCVCSEEVNHSAAAAGCEVDVGPLLTFTSCCSVSPTALA